MSDTPDPLDPSPYKVLNVPKHATLATIRSAHRKLVLITHPDKVQDEAVKKVKAEQFHQVQQAYEILSDENRRRRWDERSKLAELRAEIAEERVPLRRAQTYTAPRSAQNPNYEVREGRAPRSAQNPIIEVRDGRVYEERVPKSARPYEEDIFGASFGGEAPKPSRKYDDRYDDAPPRKTSGRGPDDRRRYPDLEDDTYERKARERRQKEEVRSVHNEKQKQRDKARKRDTEAKFSKKSCVESDNSDTDDYDDRHYSSKSDSKLKRRDDDRKRHRDEPQRRGSKKDNKSYDPDLDRKVDEVHGYLSKTRETVESDRRRSVRSTPDSYRERRRDRAELPSPPLTPPDREGRRSPGDDGRRSSARTRVARPPSPAHRTSKMKKGTEIIDPPSRPKPSLHTGGSERNGLKDKLFFPSEKEIQRSATYTQESKSSRRPGIQRSETMPTGQMRREHDPRKSSSKLKQSMKMPNTFDDVSSDTTASDFDSESETETIIPKKSAPPPALPPQSRRYKPDEGSKVKEGSFRSPFFVEEPDGYPQHRSRDISPKNSRRSSDRYLGSTVTPPPRASTFQERPASRHRESARQVPPLRTAYSSREPKEKPRDRLFGEFDDDGYPPKSAHGSPKIYNDGRFRNHSRRGSEDIDRDAYPGSLHKSHRSRGHGRSEVLV